MMAYRIVGRENMPSVKAKPVTLKQAKEMITIKNPSPLQSLTFQIPGKCVCIPPLGSIQLPKSSQASRELKTLIRKGNVIVTMPTQAVAVKAQSKAKQPKLETEKPAEAELESVESSESQAEEGEVSTESEAVTATATEESVETEEAEEGEEEAEADVSASVKKGKKKTTRKKATRTR